MPANFFCFDPRVHGTGQDNISPVNPTFSILMSFAGHGHQVMFSRLGEEAANSSSLAWSGGMSTSSNMKMEIYMYPIIFGFILNKQDFTHEDLRIMAASLHTIFPMCYPKGKLLYFDPNFTEVASHASILQKSKTSYRQILWSLDATRLGVIRIVSLWYLTGISAALLPRCLSNFRVTGK